MSCVADVATPVIADAATPATTSVASGPFQMTGTASKHRVVVSISGVALHADNTTAAHMGAVVGITLNAATSGALWIENGGEIVDTAWSWSDGPIYCGADGALTQTWPSSSGQWAQQVAIAVTPTSLIVDLGLAVIHP